MVRSALPQNYLRVPGTLFEDFENIADWTAVSAGSMVADVVNVKTGTKSLKFTTDAGGASFTTKTISADLSKDSKMVRLSVYIDCEAEEITSVIVYLSSTTNLSKNFMKEWKGLAKGWNLLAVGRDEWTNTGGESWNNTMIRMRVRVNANPTYIAKASFDNLIVGVESKPRIMIMFDDADTTAFTEGLAYMDSKGLRGTHYIVPALIGTAGYATLAQLQDAYAKGWALGNHTYDHISLKTLATQSEMEAEIRNCTNWLINNGFYRGAYHLAYPTGAYNDTVLAAMANTGMKTGRTTLQRCQTTPLENPYLLSLARNIGPANTWADTKTYVDNAIRGGFTGAILFHKLVASPVLSTEASIADFRSLIDYLVQIKADVVTIDEWYEGMKNPRYRTLPLNRPAV